MNKQVFYVIAGACVILVAGFVGLALYMGPADRQGLPAWTDEASLVPVAPAQTPINLPRSDEELPNEHSPVVTETADSTANTEPSDGEAPSIE